MDLTVRIDKGDVCMRVDDARHSQVLVDALSTALIFGLHSTGDFEAVFLQRSVSILPKFPSLVGFRRLVFSSIQSNVNDGGRGLGCNF